MSEELSTYRKIDGTIVVLDSMGFDTLKNLLKSEFRVIKENYEISHGVRNVDDSEVSVPESYARLREECSKRETLFTS
jgi:hypothetical protein